MVVTYGPELLLEQRDALVGLAEQEWQGEASVEADLDTLLADKPISAHDPGTSPTLAVDSSRAAAT